MAIWSDTKSAMGGARLRGVLRTVEVREKGLPVVLQRRGDGWMSVDGGVEGGRRGCAMVVMLLSLLFHEVGMAIWSDTKSAIGGARLRGVLRTVEVREKGLPVVLQRRGDGWMSVDGGVEGGCAMMVLLLLLLLLLWWALERAAVVEEGGGVRRAFE